MWVAVESNSARTRNQPTETAWSLHMDQMHIDREFMRISQQFNRRVDAGRPRRRPNVMTAVAVIVAAEILLTLAIILF